MVWGFAIRGRLALQILGFSILRFMVQDGAGFQDVMFRTSRLLFSRFKVANDRICFLGFMFEDLGFKAPRLF